LLTQNVAKLDSPLGAFGHLITVDGRVDAKKYGLLPLVSTARSRAIQAGITAPATIERYRRLTEAGKMHEDDLASLLIAFEEIMGVIIDQQLADIAAGIAPSTRVDPAALGGPRRQALIKAFQRIKLLRATVGSVMSV
jgi:signal-transduction protein with cAMP-binding, CBS, and nucleotidyltransferase domain